MKVVINVCYGGFSLSPQFLKTAVERNLSFVSKVSLDQWYGKPRAEAEAEYMDDVAKGVPLGDLFIASHWGSTIMKDGFVYHIDDRTDPQFRSSVELISLIEELGVEASSGELAELKIVEIPDGTDFIIEEYDGLEHVAQVHNTWS